MVIYIGSTFVCYIEGSNIGGIWQMAVGRDIKQEGKEKEKSKRGKDRQISLISSKIFDS